MINIENYWRKTGAKFMGTEDEFKKVFTECYHSMPFTDEEGYFDSFLCIKDCKVCDKQCGKHHPKINEDVESFVNSSNERLGK